MGVAVTYLKVDILRNNEAIVIFFIFLNKTYCVVHTDFRVKL